LILVSSFTRQRFLQQEFSSHAPPRTAFMSCTWCACNVLCVPTPAPCHPLAYGYSTYLSLSTQCRTQGRKRPRRHGHAAPRARRLIGKFSFSRQQVGCVDSRREAEVTAHVRVHRIQDKSAREKWSSVVVENTRRRCGALNSINVPVSQLVQLTSRSNVNIPRTYPTIRPRCGLSSERKQRLHIDLDTSLGHADYPGPGRA